MKINQTFRRLTKRHLFKLLIWIAAILGITWQLDMVFETYFNYQTVTDTMMTMPEPLDVPSVMICTSYADIMNESKWNDKIDRTNYTRNQFLQEINKYVTIRDIFDSTPDNIFENCFIRSHSSRSFSMTNCSTFQWAKFVTQEFVCYKAKPPQANIPYYSYSDSLESPGTIYDIEIKKNISKRIVTLLPVISSGGENIEGDPYMSRRLSSLFIKLRNSNGLVFTLKYERHNFNYLGFPYNDFICVDDEFTCWESCVVKHCKRNSLKLPPEIETFTKYDMKIISYDELKDSSLSKRYDDFVADCYLACKTIVCSTNYTVTSFNSMKTNYHGILLHVNTPVTFYSYTIFVPKTNLMDLFLYIVSFTGAWFGFAFVDIGSLKFRNIFSDKLSTSELNHLPSYRNRKNINSRLADLHMQHYASLFRPPR